VNRKSVRPRFGPALLLLFLPLFSVVAEPLPLTLSFDHASFSPNSDGFQERITIRVDPAPEEILHPEEWGVEIHSRTGKFIRKYSADHRYIRPGRSIQNLFIPGSDEVQPLTLFDSLAWDGRDGEGKVVPDGNYLVTVTVTTRNHVIYQSEAQSITVDTAPPLLTLSHKRGALIRPVSPDGKLLAPRGRIMISQSSDSHEGVRFDGTIIDDRGIVIETREWDSTLPKTISWNGKRKDGLFATSGHYRYLLTATDGAGNTARAEYNGIYIAPEKPDLTVECRICVASIRNGRLNHPLSFFIHNERKFLGKNSGNWFLRIETEDHARILQEISGSGKIPDSIRWDGDVLSGLLEDGIYKAHFEIRNGDKIIRSPEATLRIDSTAPRISVSASPELFSPDGDQRSEVSSLSMSYEDVTPIENWEIRIYNQPQTSSPSPIKRLYRTFHGNGLPEKLTWDGNDDNGQKPESYEHFTAEFIATDQAGNRSVADSDRLQTDILYINPAPEQRDLVARIPLQRYFDENEMPTDACKKVLNRAIKKLSLYGRYSVQLEVHSTILGREEENLKQSENRSRNLFLYFLSEGFPEEKLSFRGIGETEPQWPEERDPFEAYRNARIEIHLSVTDANP